MAITTEPQPASAPTFTTSTEPVNEGHAGGDVKFSLPSLKQLRHKFTTREGLIGSFDLALLCTPQLPCSFRGRRRVRSSPFYALDQEMPVLAALICGLQHCLAMLAGLITPPIILSSQLGFSPETQNQMTAVSLIASGILSCVQMTRFRIPRTKFYVGTGLITVVGTSFATLSTASAIFNSLYSNGTCPSETAADGTVTRLACPEAYGYLLGTQCVCSLFMMLLSFVGAKTLHRIFPPIVTGTVVMLIGLNLIGESGILAWGGGSNNCHLRPEEGIFQLCPTIYFDGKALPWGSAAYLGLGALSFLTILIVEFIGSPAMKSASIIIGLLVGCIVAAPLNFTSPATINAAPAITFLWVDTFPLKVYGPAVLPMIAVYIALACEATGDITASSEASRQPVDGPLFDSRVQGGILADGINSCISGLMMNPPTSIFAQNNGVISITRCANRTAGYVCAAFLILFGILAKISGVFLAIPNSVLGGVTTFLFASVTTSGLKVISRAAFSRRDRIILAAALGLGGGVLLHPEFPEYLFTYEGDNQALRGFMDAIIIVLSTPFLCGGILASILNATLPADDESTITHDEPETQAMERSESDDLEGGKDERKTSITSEPHTKQA